nr:uncharacterized protein LOC112795074 [Arachis hypogaea]
MYEFGIQNGRICHVYWDHIVDLPEEVEVVDVVDDEPCPTTNTVEQCIPQETPRRRSKMAIHKKPTSKKLYVKTANKENKINQSCNETQNPAYPNPSPTTQPMSHSEIPNVNRNMTQQQSEAEVPPPNNSQQEDDDIDSDPDYYQYESEDLHNPMSSDCEDDYDSEQGVWPQGNPTAPFGQVHLELGMEFATMDEFKRSVRKYNIQIGRSIKFSRVEPTKCKAICWDENCPWNIYCSRSNEPRSYQVKTFVDQHVCARRHNNKSADMVWVTEMLEEKIKDQREITCAEAETWFKKEFNVAINYKKIQRAMKKARKKIEGLEREQYAELRDYLNQILLSNPGSTVHLDTTPMPDSLPLFKRVYISFEACKKGFVLGCRPFIGLDGTFLKGFYGGQLLTAIGQYANNQIFSIAYAVVDLETRDNWKWFLEHLHNDLGNYKVHDWNFISDQQKGLIPAMQQVMPGVHHCFCAMHIWNNFTNRWKDKQLKGAVWGCCRATTTQEFDAAMLRLQRINTGAWEYLNKLDLKQ